jgi:hypothetical protein
MKNDPLARQINQIERAMRQEDPSLAKRFEKLQRTNRRNDIAVFSLLTISAVLLATAFATLSAVAGLGGVAAYLASFLVDNRHQSKLTALSQDESTRTRWQ